LCDERRICAYRIPSASPFISKLVSTFLPEHLRWFPLRGKLIAPFVTACPMHGGLDEVHYKMRSCCTFLCLVYRPRLFTTGGGRLCRPGDRQRRKAHGRRPRAN